MSSSCGGQALPRARRMPAILLLGGDKTGDGRFYDVIVRRADALYTMYTFASCATRATFRRRTSPRRLVARWRLSRIFPTAKCESPSSGSCGGRALPRRGFAVMAPRKVTSIEPKAT